MKALKQEERSHLLIVDDEPQLSEMMQLYFQHHGYAIHVAANRTEALNCAEQTQFVAVLTDLTMPDMSGTELARRLQEQQPGLPVILLSGYDLKDEHLPENVVEVLQKPFRNSVLMAVVQRVLKPEE